MVESLDDSLVTVAKVLGASGGEAGYFLLLLDLVEDEATNLILCEGGLLGSGSTTSLEDVEDVLEDCSDCDDSFLIEDGLFPIWYIYDVWNSEVYCNGIV